MNFLMTNGFARLLICACFAASAFVSADARAQQPSENANPDADLRVEQELDSGRESEAAVVAPTVYWSEQAALVLSMRSATFDLSDESFEAFGDDDYTSGQVEVGYGLGESLLPGLRGFVIYSGGGIGTRRLFGGELRMDWRRDLFMLAAGWGPELWGFFRPSVRLGGGYALQSVEMETSGPKMTDYAHDLAGFAAISVEFFTPENFLGAFRLGLLVESGYLAQTSANFDEFSRDGDGWTQQEAALGDLSASGEFFNIGVGLTLPF
jgi:hypothetical protein